VRQRKIAKEKEKKRGTCLGIGKRRAKTVDGWILSVH